MKIAFYQTRRDEVLQKEKEARALSARLSGLRLTSFCLILFPAALGYDQGGLGWFAVAACALGAFLYFLKRHARVERELLYLRSEREVLERYIARFSDAWRAFGENGGAYASERDTQAKDLDLLGKNSLYQYLCAANTAYGKQKLAEALTNASPCREEILKRGQAVKELAEKRTWAIQLQTLGNLLSGKAKQESVEDIKALVAHLEDAERVWPEKYRVLITGFPILTLCALLLACAGETEPLTAAVLMFAQLAASGLRHFRSARVLNPLFAHYERLARYKRLFRLIERADFSSTYLQELQAILTVNGGAYRKTRKLYRIGECVNMRFNLIFYLLGNSLLLWDFHTVAAFGRWKRSYGAEAGAWLLALGEFESLVSLAVFCHVKETYAFPALCAEGAPRFNAEQLRHPLIAESKAAPNDVALGAATCVVTGSNMSGKTTFLRAVGANAALAYAGGAVGAKRLELTCMRIFTSMRIEDDISKGASTFYAELLRIKTMVAYSGERRPMLVLIDEIFKGTNSADRIIGATETIKKLTNAWSITLVSTHDFELCDLAEKGNLPVVNYHFSEYYTNDEIHFDYRLKPGRCRTTNAKYLLRMAGIL